MATAWRIFLAWLCVFGLARAADAQTPGLTAELSPATLTVGVTAARITGQAGAGDKIAEISTFPDGSVHHFTLTADEHGVFVDGPFTLQLLGTYHDAFHDETTGAATELSYAGTGDFEMAAAPAALSVVTGGQASFTVTVRSAQGAGGIVRPSVRDLKQVQGALGSWSPSVVKVPPGGSVSAKFEVTTLLSTPLGSYDLVFEGVDGTVTHQAAPVRLTVTGPPPDAITGEFRPVDAVVGVTQGSITGKASDGEWVVDTSTFPDGTVHTFTFKATGKGAYVDGPFVLKQLGTYHDDLVDSGTGGHALVDYRGAGDFSASVESTTRVVSPGQRTQFTVTFESLAGFVGEIRPSVAAAPGQPAFQATWSEPAVTVKPGAPASARVTITPAADAKPGPVKIALQGTNGSVTHAAPEITMTILPP
jgi:hypothetical protein